MDLTKLTTAQKILAGTGIALLIDLVALPWHDIDFIVGSITRTAIESPNSFYGLLALLLTLAVVGVTAVQVFSPDTDLPDLPIPWAKAIFFDTIAVLALLVLKLLVETDGLGFGAYLGILLAGGMVYGGYLGQQDKAAA